MLVSPPVLVIHQVVASPEPLVLCFTAASYYYFGLRRHRLAYLALALGILSKPSTLALAIYFFIELLYQLRQSRSSKDLVNLAALAATSAFALLMPYVLIHSTAAFDLNIVVGAIVAANWGHVCMNILFNFGVLWIPFAAYLPFTTDSNRTGLIYLVLFSCIVAAIGATDWWRVWFAMLFVFVLPGAAAGIKLLCKGAQTTMVVVMAALSIIVLPTQSILNLDQVYSPDKVTYLWTAAILLLAAVAAGGVKHAKIPND